MLYPCMFCVALSMDVFVLCVTCLTTCILSFGTLCFSAISMMFVKIMLKVCIIYTLLEVCILVFVVG